MRKEVYYRGVIVACGSFLVLPLACKAQTAKVDKPNIVFILADDMGYGDISCLNSDSGIQTSHIDRLCSQGMYFRDAHSESALSTPSRYGIMTGRYCFRGSLKKGVLNGYGAPLIETGRPTIPSVLKSAGYRTAIFGKWHLGLGWQTSVAGKAPSNETVAFDKSLTYSPNDAGFEESYVLPASLDMPPYVFVSNHSVEDQTIVDVEGSDPPPYRGHLWRAGKASESFSFESCLQHLTDKGLEYIRDHSDGEKPFFVYMPLTAPHTPWLPSSQFKGGSKAGDYGDFVLNVDEVVGKVTALLDSLHISENTIVIFASDNGADWNPSDKKTYPHLSNHIWRGRKSDIWDGGHHVPLIVKYPSVVKSESSSSALVCLNDLFATLCEITGGSIPLGAAQDSYSFLPALKGDAQGKRTEVILESNNGSFAIKKGKWKLLNCSGSGGWSLGENSSLPQCQLYNMEADPGETTNLYAVHPEKVTELKALLDSIRTASPRP